MNILNKLMAVFFAADEGGTSTNAQGSVWSNLLSMLPWIIIIAAFLIFMIIMNKRSNAKRQKEADELKTSIHSGDVIKTIGGIIGTVLEVRDENGEQCIVIETGNEGSKTTMVLDFQAIYQNMTFMQRKAEEEAARKAEQERLKAERHQLESEKKSKKNDKDDGQEN